MYRKQYLRLFRVYLFSAPKGRLTSEPSMQQGLSAWVRYLTIDIPMSQRLTWFAELYFHEDSHPNLHLQLLILYSSITITPLKQNRDHSGYEGQSAGSVAFLLGYMVPQQRLKHVLVVRLQITQIVRSQICCDWHFLDVVLKYLALLQRQLGLQLKMFLQYCWQASVETILGEQVPSVEFTQTLWRMKSWDREYLAVQLGV